MLGSDALAIDPVWVIRDITGSKNIFVTCLKEWITNDTSILVHFQIGVSEEPSLWSYTLTEDYEINFKFTARRQRDTPD